MRAGEEILLLPIATMFRRGFGKWLGNRASNGTCWNFGNWEMIYADVNLDSGGTP